MPAQCGTLVWRRPGGERQPGAYPALNIRFEAPGERLKPVGKPHHRRLKKLFQEASISPWQRRRMPFVYSDDRLLMVGDLFWTEQFEQLQQQYGLRLEWQRQSPVDPAASLR